MKCALCLKAVPADRRRRRKLLGESCTFARSVLQQLCEEEYGASFLEILQEGNACIANYVLCYSCHNSLTRIHGLKQNLKQATLEVTSLLSESVPFHSQGLGLDLPAAKRQCIDSSLSQIPSQPTSTSLTNDHELDLTKETRVDTQSPSTSGSSPCPEPSTDKSQPISEVGSYTYSYSG